jgi:hypothetical protein
MVFWFRLQWIGIIFLPPAYAHFSDALQPPPVGLPVDVAVAWSGWHI